MPIADFHCDLLWYLAKDPTRTVFDPESQVSVPLLEQGGVELQMFPIYTETKRGSERRGEEQFQIFDRLHKLAPNFFGLKLRPRLAIENSSSFCGEKESLEKGIERLETWHKKHPITYISLTWNGENRFGGGTTTDIGLKEDGKILLQWMSGKKIAVDLSHASDRLGEDVLENIGALDIVPIASHSNFRAVCHHLRNLPDHLAKAIAGRGGLIGLNLVRHFLGSRGAEDILLHISHAQKLGVENHLCLGADFFPEVDVEAEKAHLRPYFFEKFSTPACYPQLRELLCSSFSETFVDGLMYKRLSQFLECSK